MEFFPWLQSSMLYLLLAAFALIPIALIAALVYAYRRLPLGTFLMVAAAVFGLPFAAYKAYERSFMLSVVPDALEVRSISYSEEESWGFGPGGNEAGIRVYPLPERVAQQVIARGLAFFEQMPPNADQQSRRQRGMYETWMETPIHPDRRWMPNPTSTLFQLYDYVCAYGFCIDIDQGIVDEAESIVNSPGSYYAYGRSGLIVVSPQYKKVLYLYNG